jgi:hypothetical protein
VVSILDVETQVCMRRFEVRKGSLRSTQKFCHQTLSYVFVLFKILVQICKIISNVSIFFSDKTNHSKIYDFLNKMNGQK